jgi:putative RNA 2'-phosphotransferase
VRKRKRINATEEEQKAMPRDKNQARLVAVSKRLSYHLRHAPEEVGLELGPGGWVSVGGLLASLAHNGFPVSREELEEVVATSDKQRYSLNAAKTQIRANQGHTIPVDLQLEPATPPDLLYHGTATDTVETILQKGLSRMARHHVHLSPTVATARSVGARHGQPVVLAIDAAAMSRDGIVFYCSANGVWLVDHVPAQYLRVVGRE